MKARLYAVFLSSNWHWHLTLDIHTDMHYWFGRHGPDTGMLILDTPLSLGQAQRIRDQMNLDPQTLKDFQPLKDHQTLKDHPNALNREFHSSKNTASTKASLTALAQKIKLTAARCGMRSSIVEAVRLTPLSYDRWRGGSEFTELRMDQTTYDQIVRALSGRSLLIEEITQLLEHQGLDSESFPWQSYVQLAHLQGDLMITNGLVVESFREPKTFWKKSTAYKCKRCGSGNERMFASDCVFCGENCPYCEECLTMGRTRYCSLLIIGGAAPCDGNNLGRAAEYDGAAGQTRDYKETIAPWGLSTAQAAASLEGLRFIDGSMRSGKEDNGGLREMPHRAKDSRAKASRATGSQAITPRARNSRTPTRRAAKFLIWAVTGAGKTEMIFPFIQHIVTNGGRVLVTTPRKDVVLELQPRVKKAFVGRSVVTLYGGSDQRWEQGEITIATTHQLLRFHEAFDLVIIDEIDAFPYHNNPVLEYAAHKACHPRGAYILLSATPPAAVRRAAQRGKLPHVKVPVRFHRHPLPVPELLAAASLRQIVKAGRLPAAIKKRLQASAERGAQLFVFVPGIQLVEPMVRLLRQEISILPGDRCGTGEVPPIEGTSSKDPLRTEKVQLFRDRAIRVLVTTTILERGVTVPKSDVFIFDSDSSLFDEAALVQMAGRAGRSKEDPAGKVYFTAKEKTKSQNGAIQQIKNMNRFARKQGYFKGDNH